MNLKKMTGKDICTGVVAACLVVCFLVYIFVYRSYNEKSELKTQNDALQKEVDDMKVYYDKMPEYKQEKTRMVGAVSTYTEDYPGDAKEEDALMLAVKMNEVATVNFNQINMDSPKVIYTVAEDVVKSAGIEGLDTKIEFVNKQITYSNLTDYSNFKRCVEEVYNSPYRVAVNTVAYTKDSPDNNFINGTIDVTFYSLRGMNKTYEYPEMPEYVSGTSDFFTLFKYDDYEEYTSGLVEE